MNVEIVISPESPRPDDEIVITIEGITGQTDNMWANYSERNGILMTSIYFQRGWDFQEDDFEFIHNWGRLNEGQHRVLFEFFCSYPDDPWNFRRAEDEFDSTFLVATGFIVRLREGWNLISTPVNPEDDNVREVTSPLVEEGSLIIVKDARGNFYLPRFNFNNIDRWEGRQGYLIKVDQDTRFVVEGEEMAEDTEIPLVTGWNFVSYLPIDEQEATEGFAEIEENLIIAKDGEGHFYLPDRGFNNIPRLHRGAGYQVKVREDIQMRWVVP